MTQTTTDTAKVQKAGGSSMTYSMARNSIMGSNNPGARNRSLNEVTPEYVPQKVLRLTRKQWFRMTLTPVLPYLDIDVGDPLSIRVQGSMDTEESPMIVLEKIGDDIEIDPNDPTAVRVQKTKSGGGRITIPETHVSVYSLGVDKETYDTKNPLIFFPMYEMGDDMLALEPMGRASELFRDPRQFSGYALPDDLRAKIWTVDEWESWTSFDRDEDGEPSIGHAQELYNALGENDELAEELATESNLVPRHFIIPTNTFETVFYRWPRRWQTVPEKAFSAKRRRIPHAMTPTLLKRAGFHLGYEPMTVERGGKQYEIHAITPGGLEALAKNVFGASPELAAILTWETNMAGTQMVQEAFASRGEVPPEDYFALSDETDLVVLPTGDAQKYPDTKVAVDVTTSEMRLADDIIDGSVDPQTLLEREIDDSPDSDSDPDSSDQPSGQLSLDEIGGASSSEEEEDEQEWKLSLEDVDESEMFWKVRPFDPAELIELYNEGLDTNEIAAELEVEPAMIEKALKKITTNE